MPIISVRYNANNRRKKKATKTKTERNKRVTQAIVKVEELSAFMLGFRQLISFQFEFRVSFIN